MPEETKAITLKEDAISKTVLKLFNTKTPQKFIKTRPGAGGKPVKYVEVGYVVNELNKAFGFFWEFKVVDKQIGKKQIWVQGQLTIKDPKTGFSITKENFGGSDVKISTKTQEPLDVANDLKSAVSDCTKKCASMFGVAADVFYKEQDLYDSMPQEVDVEVGEEAARKRILTSKYFATCSERGINAIDAKTKIKLVFKVEHMEELSLDQLEKAIEAIEKKYPKVEITTAPLEVVAEASFNDVTTIEEVDPPTKEETAAEKTLDEMAKTGVVICRCGCDEPFDPDDTTRDIDSKWFKSKACQERYYPQDAKKNKVLGASA